MDQFLRNATIERTTKKTLHRANKDWASKIESAASREVKTPLPLSGQG